MPLAPSMPTSKSPAICIDLALTTADAALTPEQLTHHGFRVRALCDRMAVAAMIAGNLVERRRFPHTAAATASWPIDR